MSKMTSELKAFYEGRTVYITGITGFKGSWLGLLLKELGANVYGIGLPPEETSLFKIANLQEEFNVIYDDITTPADQSRYVASICLAQPDVVFHLAAQPLVSEGYKNPMETFSTNIMGTVITHEILRGFSKKISLVNVTTDKVYKEGETPRKEGDELAGFDPYSLSKSCSDLITQCYRNCFNEEIISSTVRAGNVIGGGDFSENRIIPDFIRAASSTKELALRNPLAVRPYQHVFDVVLAYANLGMLQYEDREFAGEYNVGPSAETVVNTETLAREMNKFYPVTVSITSNGESLGHENPCLLLDSSKVRTKTKWKPAFGSLEAVVSSTSVWYNRYESGHDPREITREQIKGGLALHEYLQD